MLLMIPLWMALFVWRYRVRAFMLERIGQPQLIARLTRHVSSQRRLLKSALWLICVAALIAALARPAWGTRAEVIDERGAAIVVALDVSASMDAQDVLPSRLARAKLAARQIFENSQGSAVGLVLFAGTALVQFPLTTDVQTAVSFLDAASSESITQQGTAIEEALRLSMQVFDERVASGGAIILLTDGENHEGDPLAAADQAAALGFAIHIIGYGTPEGAPIPLVDDTGAPIGFRSDAAGNLIRTRLEEETLQAIADLSGTYQRAAQGGIEVVNVINALNDLEVGVLESRVRTRPVERFDLFVLVALLVLSAEMLLSESRKTA
jgi:Ca-activated chloride channel family protein